MVTDPISDLIASVKNGYMAGRSDVSLQWSKNKEAVAKVLVAKGYLLSAQTVGKTKKQDLVLTLKYHGKDPAITDIKRISKPSLRVYVGRNNLPNVLGGLGVAVMSTPMGVMTNMEAKKKNLGGEVICEVW